MSCCLDPLARCLPVEGEMDRLRILTHSDFGSISPLGQGGACGFEGQMKSEPALPQIITIKQELPTPTQYFVKSEIQDNQRFSFDNQKSSLSFPTTTPPTPTEDQSDKVLVGSTSRFLPSSSPLQPEYECIVYVRGDTSMLARVEFLMDNNFPDQLSYVLTSTPFEIKENCSKEKTAKVRLHFKDKPGHTQVDMPIRFGSQNGILCHGPETAVELPSDVSEAKIAEIAKWLQTDQTGSGFIDNTQSNIKIEPGIQLGGQITSTLSSPLPPTQLGPTQLGPVHNINFPSKRISISPTPTRQLVFQPMVDTPILSTSATHVQWKSHTQPPSPLSPAASPTDNRTTRSASSSPIRQQTVLPNPCCRLQKPPTQPVLSQEPVLTARSALESDGPPAKRRPAPMNMGSGVRGGFTPISLPESPTLLGGSPSTIPLERITTADTHPAVQEGIPIGMLSESLPAGTITLGAPETQPGFIVTSPKVHQSILIRDINHQAAPIKREAYFVQNPVDQNRLEAPTEITLGTAVTTATNNTITQSDNEHLRNQRTGRKCRKVYGVNNRNMWCTACRWKKACRRFPS